MGKRLFFFFFFFANMTNSATLATSDPFGPSSFQIFPITSFSALTEQPP